MKQKTNFRKKLDKKRDTFQTLGERMAFLDGVEWYLNQDIKNG